MGEADIVGQQMVALLTQLLTLPSGSNGGLASSEEALNQVAIADELLTDILESDEAKDTVRSLAVFAANLLKKYASEHGWEPSVVLQQMGLDFSGEL